jgi:aurora kinase
MYLFRKQMLQVNSMPKEWTLDDFENGRIPPQHQWSLQDFEFGKVLGKGGFGKVYLVWECKSKCIVALKVIKKPMNKSAKEDVLNLQAEITVQCYVSDMGRDKAPEIYGYFHTNKYVCLILEYAPSGNLLQILKANSLSEGKIACIIHQLCDIVQFTHSLNVLHQDIKPENILLGAWSKRMYISRSCPQTLLPIK